MKKILVITTTLACIAFQTICSAAPVIYDVSSAATECGSQSHGLWTNQYNNGGCNEFYDFQPGSILTVNEAEDYARLQATVKNYATGISANIDLTFGDFYETYLYYKNGGYPDYDGTDSTVDWDFFTSITSGHIAFSDGPVFKAILIGQVPGSTASTVAMPVLQIGDGANDKGPGFGASVWLDIYTLGLEPMGVGRSGHWDINMQLTRRITETRLGLILLIGLLGLALSRSLKYSKTA